MKTIFGFLFTATLLFGCHPSAIGASVEITDVREDYDLNIVGVVKNVSLPASRLSVRFVTFDEVGNKIGDHGDSTPELKPGESARFKVSIYLDRNLATRYELEHVRHSTGIIHSVMYSIAPVPEMFLTVRNRFTARASNAAREENERIQKRVAELNRVQALEFSRRPPALRAKPDPDMTNRIVAFQLRQASNGYASFQYEIGMRYLKGNGVETNRKLALFWLKSACTNGLSEATNALSKLGP